MIHLVTRLPLSYHRTLCRALDDSYRGAFMGWFAGRSSEDFPLSSSADDRFNHNFLSEVGYRKFFRSLMSDSEAVVILGGWSSPMTNRTLLMTSLLRIPVFIWADHPHPHRRTWMKDRARKLHLKLISGVVSGFLGCGRATVEHLRGLGLDGTKLTEFPYWVDVPQRWSLPPVVAEQYPLRLIAIGRLVKVKQFEVAIKAVALTNARANQRLVELVLVGDGPARATLESTAKSLRCADAIHFYGWLEAEELFRQIELADALVLTSSFDAYGVVVLEAMARGRPVLASDGVVAALDRDDGSGAIIRHPAGDTELLAQQIELFANERERLLRASLAARAIAEKWKPQRAASILDSVLVKSKRGAILVKNRRGQADASLEPAGIPGEASLAVGQ
ncbi:MAG TPA: glycosyltransferase family 4 protein [Pyrinomonadaceae bacterium]